MRKVPHRLVCAAVVAAVLLAMIAALAYFAEQILERNMADALGRQEYLRAKLSAERYDGLLAARSMSLAVLAEALPAPGGRNTESMKKALAEQSSLAGAFLNVALFAKSGDLVFSARPPVSRLFAAGTRPYFIEAVLQKRGLLSQPFTSALTGTPVVVLAHPLLDPQGQVEYVLVASLALAEPPIAAPAEGGGRIAYVTTADGYLVSYPLRAKITHHVHEISELDQDAALGLQGFEGWRLNESAGTVHAFARLKQAPWIVGLQVPGETVFAPLTKARERIALFAAALAVIAVAISWPLSRFIATPPARMPAQAPAAATSASPAAPAEFTGDTTVSRVTPTVSTGTTGATFASHAAPAESTGAIFGALVAPADSARHAGSTEPASGSRAESAATAGSGDATVPATAPTRLAPAAVAAAEASSAAAASADASPAPGAHEAQAAAAASSAAETVSAELDLDAFMQTNFTTDEQRRSFISTITASIRKLPTEVAAVSSALQAAPAQATTALHTLKGAWGSLGARNFAQAAAQLEGAVKAQQPTANLHAEFEREGTALYAAVNAWLAKDANNAARDEAPPAGQLLPLLRERNISAAVLYETSRSYWDKQLGAQAHAFSAAMDALDFDTAERLLISAQS